MTLLLLLTPLLASQPDTNLPRTTEGVASGINELQSDLQDCVSQDIGTGTVTVRLRFTVDVDGVVGAVESLNPESDPALTACMAAPFSALRFASGKQEMPVEVPISVQRTLTEKKKPRTE